MLYRLRRNCVSLRICGRINKSKDAMIGLQLKAETDIMRREGGGGEWRARSEHDSALRCLCAFELLI